MIKLITNIDKMQNDIADIIRLFYSFEKIIYDTGENAQKEIYHTHSENESSWNEKIVFNEGVINKEYSYDYKPPEIKGEIEYKRYVKRSAKFAFYFALKEISGKTLPWGSLTGIRPTQLYRMLDDESGGRGAALLKNDYDVSEDKMRLVEDIILHQKDIYQKDRYESVNLYVGIPFCPTRCEYCSFISFDMSRHKAPLEEYTDAVIKEIIWFNNWRKENGKGLRSIYFGGGTPTSIGASYLKKIIDSIEYETGVEFTVEAGRPDTIDNDMLKMLSDTKVNRISINPQSMNDETLIRMKRPHTAGEIIEAYNLARKFDFLINMDLILGLEGETLDSVNHTLDEIEKLDTDNLTVHSLAVKRASKLKENMDNYNFTDVKTINEMVELAQKRAYEMNMHPYYMYRQKYISGNLENVGFAKEGADCIYNIDIMEESHNLIAIGAGAVSKRMYYDEKRHARFYNNKSIKHYIENIDSQLLKKDDFFARIN